MPVSLVYEEVVPAFWFTGTCQVEQEEQPLVKQNVIIKRNLNEFDINFEWCQDGFMCAAMAGTWKLKVYFEKMGMGETNFAPELDVPFVAVPGHTYSVGIHVDPDAPSSTLEAGVYRVIAQLLFEGPPPGKEPIPIAAFGDIGLIQLYDAI